MTGAGGPAEGGEKQVQPIIIKRRKAHAHAHHGGAWKVAYADFVTAMMAFFLVMWLVSQSDEVKMNIAGYFQDPIAFGQAGGVTILDGGAPRGGKSAADPSASPAILYDKNAAMKARLEKEAKEIVQALDQVAALKDVMDQIEVEATSEGLRIQLMENEDSHFFEIGGSKLSPSGVDVVAAIGRVIGPLGRGVAVEGHTDSHKYSQRAGYTNWELSADRANAARLLLQSSGVSPAQVKEIRGYADTRLKYADAPEDPRNRRIAILVLNGSEPAAPPKASAAPGGATAAAARREPAANDHALAEEREPAPGASDHESTDDFWGDSVGE